jgi:hypothetical protein
MNKIISFNKIIELLETMKKESNDEYFGNLPMSNYADKFDEIIKLIKEKDKFLEGRELKFVDDYYNDDRYDNA